MVVGHSTTMSAQPAADGQGASPEMPDTVHSWTIGSVADDRPITLIEITSRFESVQSKLAPSEESVHARRLLKECQTKGQAISVQAR